MTAHSLTKWLIILVAAAIAQYIFRYIWRVNIWGTAAKLERTLRTNLFKYFTQILDHVFFQKYRTGDLMAHATNDLSAIQMVAGANFNIGGFNDYRRRYNCCNGVIC